ncbi:hypothetical protein [Bradyrhizobium sp. USDA 3650]
MMANWEAELEAMLAQTNEIARRGAASIVPGKQLTSPVAAVPLQGNIEAVLPTERKSTEREEIEKRIESFRAHQRRFAREREDYAAETIARMRRLDPKINK